MADIGNLIVGLAYGAANLACLYFAYRMWRN